MSGSSSSPKWRAFLLQANRRKQPFTSCQLWADHSLRQANDQRGNVRTTLHEGGGSRKAADPWEHTLVVCNVRLKARLSKSTWRLKQMDNRTKSSNTFVKVDQDVPCKCRYSSHILLWYRMECTNGGTGEPWQRQTTHIYIDIHINIWSMR